MEKINVNFEKIEAFNVASMLKEEWKKAKEEYQKADWISFILVNFHM